MSVEGMIVILGACGMYICLVSSGYHGPNLFKDPRRLGSPSCQGGSCQCRLFLKDPGEE